MNTLTNKEREELREYAQMILETTGIDIYEDSDALVELIRPCGDCPCGSDYAELPF